MKLYLQQCFKGFIETWWSQNLNAASFSDRSVTRLHCCASPHAPTPTTFAKYVSFPSIIFHHQVPKLWDAHHNNTICISKACIAKASFWDPCRFLRGHQDFMQIKNPFFFSFYNQERLKPWPSQVFNIKKYKNSFPPSETDWILRLTDFNLH